MKPIRTYILIADGARARLLFGRPGKAPGRGAGFGAVAGYQARSRAQRGAAGPGRRNSATVARHAIERDDLHRREKERFAQALAAASTGGLRTMNTTGSLLPRRLKRSASSAPPSARRSRRLYWRGGRRI